MSYDLQFEKNPKKGYGGAALIVGLLPIILFPVFMFMPLLSLALSLLAIILGAVSINTSRKKLAVAGLVTGMIGFIYISAILFRLW